MNYQINSDNMSLTPSMEVLTKQKFERLEHRVQNYPEDTKSARVVINTAPNGMFTVKAKVLINGKEYFSDETDYSVEGALIKTVEEIFNMMDKEKSIYEKKREASKDMDYDLLAEDVVE